MNNFTRWLRAVSRLLPAVALLLLVPACEHGAGQAFHKSPDLISLSKANFNEQVLASSEPVLVDFWADWCGPCKMLAPNIVALAAEYRGRVKFGTVNVDKEEALVEQNSVEAFPTLLLFKGGKLMERVVGYTEKEELQAKLNQLLQPVTTTAPKPASN